FILILSHLLLHRNLHHLHLHSFPTRRSSDLSQTLSKFSFFGSRTAPGTRSTVSAPYVLASRRAVSRSWRARARTLGSGSEWRTLDRKSTRLNSSHDQISYAVFCLKKKRKHAK